MKQHKKKAMSRREFASSSALAALSFHYVPSRLLGSDAPSNTLNIAGIGVGGMGATNLRACKEGSNGTAASANFEYGGALTEMVLLGMVAIQVKDQTLERDAANLKFKNNDRANELLHIRYRDGWKL